MTLTKLEWLRLVRGRGAIIGAVVFIFFGLTDPLMTYYSAEIIERISDMPIPVQLPDPTPAMLVQSYVSDALSALLIAVVAVLAKPLTPSSSSFMTGFLRSRAPSGRIIRSRMLVGLGFGSACWTLGLAAAVYEASVLMQPLRLNSVLLCWVAGLAVFAMVVGLIAMVGSVSRSAMATITVALLVLALVGAVSPLIGADWYPGRLPEIAFGALEDSALWGDLIPPGLVAMFWCLFAGIAARRRLADLEL